MKLRIKGNSIRLRLSKAEVAQVQVGQKISEKISFGQASELIYSLSPSRSVDFIRASFDGKTVQILVPEKILNAWAYSEEVSIQSDNSESVSILIEKDFF